MSERVRAEKTSAKQRNEAESEVSADTKEELKAEMDALLGEIDSVLEENAEDFVNQYVQKGGQ